jgi:hypothetical protein
LVYGCAAAQVQQFFGDQGRAFRQSGSVLKDLFGEGLHGDSSELVEVWPYI